MKLSRTISRTENMNYIISSSITFPEFFIGTPEYELRIFSDFELIDLIIIYRIQNEYYFDYSKNRIKTHQNVINFLIRNEVCKLVNVNKYRYQYKLTREVLISIL